jgi:ATP-dependent DNA helicase RecQ
VNEADVKKFSAKYGKASRYIPHPQVEAKGQKVFSLNLDKIWRLHFSDQNFPQMKKAYFDKQLFQKDDIYVSPQIRIIYNLNQSVSQTYELLARHFDTVAKALNETASDFFTEEMFVKTLEGKYESALTARRIAELILSVYSSPLDPKSRKDIFVKSECFIQQKKSDHEFLYKTFAREYLSVRTFLKKRYDRMLGDMKPDERSAHFFIPANDDKNIGMIQLAYLLEAFNLATFVIGGGEKPGMFIRINDPVKLNRLAKRGYKNEILTEIDRRQKISLNIMEYFFTHQLDTQQRWDFIEKYFLGTPAKELTGHADPEDSE